MDKDHTPLTSILKCQKHDVLKLANVLFSKQQQEIMLSMILCGWNIVKVVTLSENFTYMSKEMEAMVVCYSLCNMLASSHLYRPPVRVVSSVKKTNLLLHTIYGFERKLD